VSEPEVTCGEGSTRGHFIAFEGGEASGKSTQAQLLATRLGALLTREPGGTALGERVRELLLDPATDDLDARTELLLMAAARAEHVARVIGPSLAAGRDVVCDRFGASSVAYQGHGRGLPPDEVVRVSAWAAAGLEPDLVVLLDVDAATRHARLGDRPDALDRLESAGEAFHARVADGFRAMAAADPERWVRFDGSRPVDELAEAIADSVGRRFGGRGQSA
jgi:dTMP kinase